MRDPSQATGLIRVAFVTSEGADPDGDDAAVCRGLVAHAPDDMRVAVHDQYHFTSARQLVRRLRLGGVDLIHAAVPLAAGVSAAAAAAQLGLPLIASWASRASRPDRWWTPFGGAHARDALAARVYRGCSRVLAASAADRACLLAAGCSSAHVLVAPPGVDAQVFAPERRSPALRTAWGVSDERPGVLYTGPLDAGLDLDLLGRLNRLLVEHRLPHRFVICGDGPLRDRLRREVPDAIFTGAVPRDRVGAIMASCDLFVLPAHGSGRVVLEAQAAGLPALVAEHLPASEQIHDRITGYACARASERAFGCRLAVLLVDAARRRAMGAAARAWALTRTWPLVLAPVFAAYRTAWGDPASTALGRAPASSRWTRRSIERAS